MAEKHELDVGLRAADAERTVDDLEAPGVLIYERILPAVPACVGRFRSELRDALEWYAVTVERCHEIVLVLSEAATNAVLHAYVDASPGPIYVSGSLEGPALIVLVCDCGLGIRPRIDSPGAGLGMSVMARFADRLEIRADGSNGTCVHATFESATAAPPGRDAAVERGEMLGEYLRVLAAEHVRLAEDTHGVVAQAQHARMRARRLRQERAVTAGRGGG